MKTMGKTGRQLIEDKHNWSSIAKTVTNIYDELYMKIVQVVPYYPPHIGGMETYASELCNRLARKGHQVDVFTSDVGSKPGNNSSTVNLNIHRLKSWEFAHTPIVLSLLAKLLKIPRDSIIHVHIAQAFIPEIVYLASRIRHVPYVAYVHADIEPTGTLGFLLPFYKTIILRFVLKSASKIIVPTRDYIDIISEKYAIPEHKIVVIPCGVDLQSFRSTSTKLHDPVRLLFVGRLSRPKNISLLLGLIKEISPTHPSVNLFIVGDGEEREHIEAEIARHEIGSEVQLVGSLTGASLYRIYSESDILLFPSLNESFGIVLIEAMASGLPIIASNILAVRDVINNNYNGLLVKPILGEIANAVEQLLTNPELRDRLITNGLEEVKKYNWDNIGSEFEVVYKEVLYDNNNRSTISRNSYHRANH